MARAHLYRALTDAAGNVRKNATVRVLEPASTTPIDGALYKIDSGTDVLTNPYSTASGLVDFYLDAPKRVRLGVKYPNEAEVFFEDVDVILPFDLSEGSDTSVVEGAINQVASDLAAHLADPEDAHDASAISVIARNGISATNVQAALEEIDAEAAAALEAAEKAGDDLAAHLADPTDAHDASAISFVPVGDLSSTNVQAAIEELQAETLSQAEADALFLTPVEGNAAYALKAHEHEAVDHTHPTGPHTHDYAATDHEHEGGGGPTEAPEPGEGGGDPYVLKFCLQAVVSGDLEISPSLVRPGLRVVSTATAHVMVARLDQPSVGGPVTITAERWNNGVFANNIGTVTLAAGDTLEVVENLNAGCSKGDIVRFRTTSVGSTVSGADLNIAIDFIDTPVP